MVIIELNAIAMAMVIVRPLLKMLTVMRLLRNKLSYLWLLILGV
jgi:hypothetical protein